jgi:hypothetical protein
MITSKYRHEQDLAAQVILEGLEADGGLFFIQIKPPESPASPSRRATTARGARSLARCTSSSNVPNDANIRTPSLYRPLISGR